jgi:hypothetical protein
MPADDWLRRFTDFEGLDDHEPTPPTATTRPASGGDAGSAGVQVVVDESGAVRDVLLAPNWRRSIQPAALGEALLTSANAAILGAIELPVELPVTPTRPAAADASSDPAALEREILDLFARFDTDLAAYQRQLLATTAPQVATGMNRRVSVTMAGGVVESVQVDVRWAERSRYTEIATEALTAFSVAQQATEETRAAVREPSSLARLRELSGDPLALCRQLGLGPSA